MKSKIFTGLLTGFVVSAIANMIIAQPSHAGNSQFFCGILNKQPVTLMRTVRGNVVMIRWVSNDYFPPPWTAQRRCQEVARRFQRNYDNGYLKYINPGRLNGEPVVCAGLKTTEPCTNRNLLFTLKRGANPDQTLQRLMDRGGLRAGYFLSEDGSASVDVEIYLDEATVEENVSPIENETDIQP
jgi:Circadian oscillating protein COP23